MTARVALVTGGSRGIGLAIAETLARSGHRIALMYQRDEAAAEAAQKSLQALGAEVSLIRADIADPQSVRQGVLSLVQALGPPTVLVNNAFRGGRTPAKTHDVPAQEWTEDLRTNLNGPFFVTQACLPYMIEAQFGRIVFIGSLASRGEPGRVAYATAKAALTGLSGTVAREYARHGITSNVVHPGFIEAGAFERLPEEVRTRALKSVPSRRAGQKEEVAALIDHLTSESAAYLTGQVIGVDGGAR